MSESCTLKEPGGRKRGGGETCVFRPERNEARDEAPAPSPEERYRRIAAAAYFRAERRGFEPGHEIEDWLAAEREVDDELGCEGLIERLRRERDELRVRMHLARLELREEWDELERKWDAVRARSGSALREAREAGKEVGLTVASLLGEIRDGYKRIRGAL